jgi:hypothetical protein
MAQTSKRLLVSRDYSRSNVRLFRAAVAWTVYSSRYVCMQQQTMIHAHISSDVSLCTCDHSIACAYERHQALSERAHVTTEDAGTWDGWLLHGFAQPSPHALKQQPPHGPPPLYRPR